jgi:hypothetical protein
LWVCSALIAALAVPAPAAAARLSVEVWTNRGDEAVYKNGDLLQLGARANEDGHLLVYEIDADGYVNLLFPYQGASDFIDRRETYRIPDGESDLELVVEGPVGQGYVVAVFSTEPFEPMPWYLRPYNAQAATLGYQGEADQEEGITAEGRIVGDPYVAMERIRRRVVRDADNIEAFATAYTTYYLHEQVKYPRYLCADCHRADHWSWWPGFDPYYTTCSVFDFRVNYSWHWGPSYWFGHVPYYVYSCFPGYGWRGRTWYSGWDGWGYWSSVWGGPLRRHKSDPPPGYVPPERYKGGTPPGLIAAHERKKGGGMILPIGKNSRPRSDDDSRPGIGRDARPGEERQPAGQVRPGGDTRRPNGDRDGIDRRPNGDRDAERRPSGDRGGIQRRPAGSSRGGDDVQRPTRRPAERPAPAREPKPEKDSGRSPDPPAPQPSPVVPVPPAPAPAPEPDRQPRQKDEARPGRDGSRGKGNQIGGVERGIVEGRAQRGGVVRGRGSEVRLDAGERRVSRRLTAASPDGALRPSRQSPAPVRRLVPERSRMSERSRSAEPHARMSEAPRASAERSRVRVSEPPRGSRERPRAEARSESRGRAPAKADRSPAKADREPSRTEQKSNPPSRASQDRGRRGESRGRGR